VEDLRVVARTSVFVFKGKSEDIREIGKKLNVETLLEGSIRKSGNRLRVSAQLINVEDGYHIWSGRFDREMEDVFAIQDEISLAIARELKVRLLKGDKAKILKHHTGNLEAYNMYLKGLYYLRILTPEGYEKAIEFFEQSLERDPNYALAYDGLGRVNISRSYWGNLPPDQAYPNARTFTKKALEIDFDLAEAHASLGFISVFYDWNWTIAEQEFNLARNLNPNSANSRIFYSFFLTITGRHEEAILEARRAQELDPLSSFISTHLGTALIYAGRCDEAIGELRMALSMNPNYFLAYLHLGMAYRAKSMIEEAIAEFEKALELSIRDPWATTNLATIYYQAGKEKQADKLINSLKERSRNEYIPPMCFYLFHLVRSDLDQAFPWLERAFQERDSFLLWGIVSSEESYKLPPDPRFQVLITKIGLDR
jgi:serine/threonine-protein kinase